MYLEWGLLPLCRDLIPGKNWPPTFNKCFSGFSAMAPLWNLYSELRSLNWVKDFVATNLVRL